MTGSLGLYFHIPFCKKKCPYCHFFVVAGVERHRARFLSSLKLEWEMRLGEVQDRPIESIYFGGGTPTEIGAHGIAEILHWIRLSCQISPYAEITVETNPDNVTPQLMDQLLLAGVNRLSIGVQSLAQESLHVLGRTHSSNQAREAIHIAHRAGMHNISIDLMYDLPHQTRSSFLQTLAQLASLPITHLSLYNLIIEPHSAFFHKKEAIEHTMPQDEASLELLEDALSALHQAGLERYEISAFAKTGYKAVHNMRYWKGGDFLGFGPSAFSYMNQSRFQNVPHLMRYFNDLDKGAFPISFEETLPYPNNVNELLAIRLRILEGVDPLDLPTLPNSTLEQINRLLDEGLLKKTGNRIALSTQGTLFYDSVATALI
ncbi:MAG: radical SAM family heme chaperone HemW [Simkaniaceae bacterium]|nr:radical SAM family heme chaperone HemW [Simkaniaceae bacterium]